MADRPISFTAPMVRALLEGRKTQTRRLLMQAPPARDARLLGLHERPGYNGLFAWFSEPAARPRGGEAKVAYRRGDRLWVKERYAKAPPTDFRYEATDDIHELRRVLAARFMPRCASRLTLLVTAVRVQRLQEITRDDALAEGVARVGGGVLRWEKYAAVEGHSGSTPQAAYALLWNSLNAARGFGWDTNPWVAALTFTVHPGNIDAPGASAPVQPASKGADHAA